MDNSNAMIVRKAYQDFADGDVAAVFSSFDEGIAWHVPGHSPLSGKYKGHDQVRAFFQRTMELSRGSFRIEVHQVLAGDDLVVVLATISARRNEVSACFSEVHVWTFKSGKIVSFREYQGDEQREDAFWS